MKTWFETKKCTVFLALAGAMVPAGLRSTIADLIRRRVIDALVSTGANMVHDMVEALGYRHIVGSFQAEDRRLKRENIGRIGDVFIEQKAFQALEKWLYKTLETIPEEKRRRSGSTRPPRSGCMRAKPCGLGGIGP
jgi:deoxyhypusine synthase